MTKHNIVFVPDFLFKSSGNYNNGLIDFLDSVLNKADVFYKAGIDGIKNPDGSVVKGSDYSVYSFYYGNIIDAFDGLVAKHKTDINKYISKTDLIKLCQLDATIKDMLNLRVPYVNEKVANDFKNNEVLSMYVTPAEETMYPAKAINTDGVLTPSQQLREIIVSNTGKPYDLYVRSNTIYVIVKTGFGNLLISHRKAFSLLLLGELVREFGRLYGNTKLYGTSLFTVFMLNQELL